MAKVFSDARLEIVNSENGGYIRIEGERHDTVFAWMQLTTAFAESVGIPLPKLLAGCAALGKDFEELNRLSEDCRIDLSHPHKITVIL